MGVSYNIVMEAYYHDPEEGHMLIGKLPEDMTPMLDSIAASYDSSMSAYHISYHDISADVQQHIEAVGDLVQERYLSFVIKGAVIHHVVDLDSLYISGGPTSNNLYGTTTHYDRHKDSIFHFPGVHMYRALVGLTDGNDAVVTRFCKHGVDKTMGRGDVVIFDYDRTSHQVLCLDPRHDLVRVQRKMVKMHFMVCDPACSPVYVDVVKHVYIWHEYITRKWMTWGTDPQEFSQFFCGLSCELYTVPNLGLYVSLFTFLTCICLAVSWRTCIRGYFVVILLYLMVVFWYWTRYQLYHIR